MALFEHFLVAAEVDSESVKSSLTAHGQLIWVRSHELVDPELASAAGNAALATKLVLLPPRDPEPARPARGRHLAGNGVIPPGGGLR